MTNAPRDQIPPAQLVRVRAFVSGRVQGVGFRAFTSRTVASNGLRITGWVRNLPDGRVELLAEGPAADVERLLAEVAKGPSGAKVEKIERKDEAPAGDCSRFGVAY